jgi:C4-type Zn-finger protein
MNFNKLLNRLINKQYRCPICGNLGIDVHKGQRIIPNRKWVCLDCFIALICDDVRKCAENSFTKSRYY